MLVFSNTEERKFFLYILQAFLYWNISWFYKVPSSICFPIIALTCISEDPFSCPLQTGFIVGFLWLSQVPQRERYSTLKLAAFASSPIISATWLE